MIITAIMMLLVADLLLFSILLVLLDARAAAHAHDDEPDCEWCDND